MNAPISNPKPTAAELRQRLIRNIHEVPLEHFVRAPLYEGHSARLGPGTAARQLGCSFDVVPPGKQTCPYHLHHAQEELFVILEGSGTLRVAGERLPVKAGDVIFMPAGPEYPHQILNTSDAPLKYLSLSTKQYPEVCEYPDSGKFMAWSWKEGQETLAELHASGNSLDYWHGEP
jgi:uncharacterized cupin superfamily protein